MNSSSSSNSILPAKDNVNRNTTTKYSIQESENNSGSFNLQKNRSLVNNERVKSHNSINNTSINNIASQNKDVNTTTKYSIQEFENNSTNDNSLEKKYSNLNLNENISNLDGVPAIELSDGSILPIKTPQTPHV